MGIFPRKKGNGGKNEGLWVVGFGVLEFFKRERESFFLENKRERDWERESSGSLLDN